MAKREQHRQGVIYGPVRPSGRRDRGAIIGSLLGVFVVVGTVGLLGFGIVTFLQGRANAPLTTADPTAIAGASASPDASGSPAASPSVSFVPTALPASPTPLPTATLEPTPAITPAPTPFVPAVNVGPGFVTFGTNSNSRLEVTDPKTVFDPNERMVWSAYLNDTADSVDLRIVITKLDPDTPNGERLVSEGQVRPIADDVSRFLRRVRVRNLIDGPGLYTVRYVRGSEVMSEGSFLVPEQDQA